ncbi:MAG: hypothetical protein MUF60_07435, partial [Vicinamibacterales bacterium]|nr:hypothetical protein [Vicinamibacterales bacterium]
MLIRFGLALDGYEAREPRAAPGELTTGPIGLLDYLEARLELGGRRPTRAVRVAQYERCLALADDGGRFYSRSFATDPLGVADTLLDWRDQWVAGGWDGRGDRSDGERLADLADVERVARDVLAPGSADRLSAVAAGLSGCGSSGIDRVQLFDSPGELPRLWRRVLDALNVEIVEWGGWPTPMAPPGSDLTALQGALLGTGRPTFRGDGSVLVLEADSDPALAQGLATCFGPETGWSTADTTVVVGECGGILDLGLRAAGLPVAGLAERSPWRAASQVLRLALNLLWAPLDPSCLLEFLTLPVSPIDDPMRLRLARVVADAPGIGGAA